MSSPAHRLGSLSLNETMPLRSRGDESAQRFYGPSGKAYDLSSLPAAQADVAQDGLRSEQMRLVPVLAKATYPEAGFVGFEVTEIHRVRVPLPDEKGSRTSDVHCNCTTFQRLRLCDHVVWLYDGLQASINATATPPSRSIVESLTEQYILQRFANMATQIPLHSKGLAERINHIQHGQLSQEDIDRDIIDVFAVFDGAADDSPRKRRRPEENVEDLKSNVPKLRTCLEISRNEFFDEIAHPENDMRDVVVSGGLLATMKGLVRYGTLFREALFNVVDPHFRAGDFISRLDCRLSDWKDRWENFRKDRRTTVPSSFVTDYADTIREVLRQMKAYDDNRDCPDSYYDNAIDLGITILDEVCKSNADLYEGHSRQNSQARHTVPQNTRDRNLFTNLILDPPSGQTKFVQSFVEMLFQFGPSQFDDSHIGRLRQIFTDMSEIETVNQDILSPLQNFFQRYIDWRRRQVEYQGLSSSPSRASPATQNLQPETSQDQGQTRRYRELRAAPPST